MTVQLENAMTCLSSCACSGGDREPDSLHAMTRAREGKGRGRGQRGASVERDVGGDVECAKTLGPKVVYKWYVQCRESTTSDVITKPSASLIFVLW